MSGSCPVGAEVCREAHAEVERLHSWDGLMELLDEHWPEDVFFPAAEYCTDRDAGPRIVSLLRWVQRLQLATTECEAAVERLRRWKVEALPVLDGLQELGKALGLPLGSRITGTEALAAVERLTRERDEARAEAERLRAGMERRTRTGYSHTPDCERERESARLDWHPDCGRCWEDSLHDLLNPTEGEK